MLCLCALLFAGAFGSAGCAVKPIPLVLGVDTEISIAMPAGAPCTILVQPGSSRVEEITVPALPQSGILTLRGRTGVVYRPQAGFRGEDSFTFSLSGRSGSTSGASTIRVRARIG
jgi:hypothetical protein